MDDKNVVFRNPMIRTRLESGEDVALLVSWSTFARYFNNDKYEKIEYTDNEKILFIPFDMLSTSLQKKFISFARNYSNSLD